MTPELLERLTSLVPGLRMLTNDNRHLAVAASGNAGVATLIHLDPNVWGASWYSVTSGYLCRALGLTAELVLSLLEHQLGDLMHTETITPIRDNVLLQLVEADELSPGGIIVPGTAKKRTVRAKVLAVGPGRGPNKDGQFTPVPITPGDIAVVPFADWAIGQELNTNDGSVRVINSERILGVYEP